MSKKFFKYIICVFTVLFIFNTKVSASTIISNISEKNSKVVLNLNTNEFSKNIINDINILNNSKDCEGLFGDSTYMGKYIKDIYNILKFAVPIILLALSIKDFGTAVINQNQDAIKKATQTFIKRLIIAVLILIVPTLLNFILELLDFNTCTL